MLLINHEAGSRKEIINKLSQLALSQGYINKEFIENILVREEEFPTGLETAVPVAIPHIGEGCLKSFLSVATLKKPIKFESMDGSGKELDVQIVFMFGITEPQEQVDVLKRFISVFREEENLQSLLKAKDSAEALKQLKVQLGDYLQTK